MSDTALVELAMLIGDEEFDVSQHDGKPHDYTVPTEIGVTTGEMDEITREISDMTPEEAYAAGRLMNEYEHEYE